ncbi:glycosyltransferase family 39 protein [Methylobacterium mesophilicum SR1.6/6]|uniref:Glycosyltransferase family 39 protein n=1 Tax=Methylobacterium mesophilicum SR1.6/6 TaxID=908290 RepID=A0A6B9FU94_9HYPH|nr:glycosyltransferase family 39 protein [Methylobacterium mesophilicum]QGY04524.1 glycosyltransferase family 39 protein [Methylobacterium mesophilicum SR1.6/6]
MTTSLSAGGTPRLAHADRVGRGLDALSVSHGRAVAALLALCLVMFLPGQISMQPMDRDEPRFAQASKQMLETGDLVDIRFQGEARHKKPVGIYWAQAAAVAAGEALGVPEARTQIALYRIPSLLGATVSVLLAYWAALAFLSRRFALLAAALYGGCLMLAAEAHLAKTDALLVACATASLGALARAWLAARDGRAPAGPVFAAFWVGMALGILVKGPMVPLFVALPALILSVQARSGRWLLALRPVPGLALTVLLVAPWFAAIAWKSGGAFYAEAVGHDMLGKVGGAAERHWGPPGAYALAFFATFWPGAAFAAMSLPFAWRARREAAVSFLIAAVLPAWLIFEAVPTKLPHYVLPLMPWLAILTVLALSRGALDPRLRGARLTALLLPAIPAALTLGLCLAGWRLDAHTLPWPALPLLAAACVVAALGWLAFAQGSAERALVLGVLASCLLGPAVLGVAQLSLPALKVSPRLAALRDRMPCPNPEVASLGYREPSLVFLVGTGLALPPDGAAAKAFLEGGGCRLLFVEARDRDDFNAAWPVGRGVPAPLAEVDGFNLNTGRRVFVTAYGVVP